MPFLKLEFANPFVQYKQQFHYSNKQFAFSNKFAKTLMTKHNQKNVLKNYYLIYL